MCGISGFQILSSKVSFDFEKKIRKINNVINHRGPDAEGYWSNQKHQIYFGHKRLAIIDLSPSGKQPMRSNNGRYTITYNGEIYNYQFLRKILQNKFGIKFSNKTDTQVLLELVSIHGLKKAIKMVEGMFAFALHDKEKNTVSLVRDRFGEKPLFYYLDDNFLIFSSELKSIKSFFEPQSLNISKTASVYYKALGYIPAPLSIYENTLKVLPSELIEFRKGKIVNKKKYWFYSDAPTNYDEAKDEVGALETEIENSVKKMMVADVEVGCFLSGGIDSSLIAALMQKNSLKKINTFTVGFKEDNYDESVYAKKISEYLNTNHNEIIVSIDDMIKNIERIIKNFDEPFADSSALPTEIISSFARKRSKVILSGDGGDEIFLGYNRYLFSKRVNKLKNFIPKYLRRILQIFLRAIPSGPLDYLSIPFHKSLGIHGFSHKISKLSNILIFDSNENFYKKLNLIDNDQLGAILNEKNELFSKYNKLDLLTSLQRNDIDHYLSNDILTKVDRSSMLNSLEVRSPFLNHLVAEKAGSISNNLKIKGNNSKYILKYILEKYIPKKYFLRPKMGFAIPIERWFNNSSFINSMNDWIYNVDWGKLYYDKFKVHKTWTNYKKYKSYPAIKIWSLLVSSIWIRNNTH